MIDSLRSKGGVLEHDVPVRRRRGVRTTAVVGATGLLLSLAACKDVGSGGTGGGESSDVGTSQDGGEESEANNLANRMEESTQTCKGIKVGPIILKEGAYLLQVTAKLNDKDIKLIAGNTQSEAKVWFSPYESAGNRVRGTESSHTDQGFTAFVPIPPGQVAGVDKNVSRATLTITSSDPPLSKVCHEGNGPFPQRVPGQ